MKAPKIQLGWQTDSISNKVGFDSQPKPTKKTKKRPLILDDEEGHLLTIAPTGKGKGRSAIIPTLLNYPGPVMVIDPKGEAAAVTAKHRRKFGKVIIVDPFKMVTKRPAMLNPLDILELSNGSVTEHALRMSQILFTDQKSSEKEPFWEQKAKALISGILSYIIACEPKENRNFVKLRKILSSEDVTYNLAVLMDTKGKQMPEYAKEEIGQFLQTTDVTRSGILSTAQQYVQLFGDKVVADSISSTSFDLKSYFRGKPQTIYLVLPPNRLKSHSVILRLWVATLIDILIERKKRPEIPNLFLIDEAAQLGTLDTLRTATTLLRGYGLRVWTFWQDLSQLKHHYKSDWQTIVNNCASFQIFGITTYLMAKELSSIIGVNNSAAELLRLSSKEQIIMSQGGKVEKSLKLDYLSDKIYQGLYAPNPYFGKNWNTKSN